MPAFDYATIRVVPRVELGGGETVGVILQCRQRRFLGVRWIAPAPELAARWPGLGRGLLVRYLTALERVASGEGPLGHVPASERFHWLTAPRSTVVQPSAVHTGVADDPEAVLERIAAALAAPEAAGAPGGRPA